MPPLLLRAQRCGWLGRLVWTAAFTGLTGGCALTGLPPTYVANGQTLPLSPIVIYQGSSGPLSYQAPDPGDAQAPPGSTPVVTGEACQSGFQLPWAYSKQLMGSISAGWGQGGYVEALTRAQAKAPAHSLLYDVRVDLRQTSVLSLWRQLCLIVTANVAPDHAVPAAPFNPNEAMQSHGQNRS